MVENRNELTPSMSLFKRRSTPSMLYSALRAS